MTPICFQQAEVFNVLWENESQHHQIGGGGRDALAWMCVAILGRIDLFNVGQKLQKQIKSEYCSA